MKKINFVNGQAPALSAENLNQMQDNMEEAISYSLEEKQIGKWIDGKPLYRKTIVYSNTETLGKSGETVNYEIPHGIQNLKQLTDIKVTHHGGYVLPAIGPATGGSIGSATICMGTPGNSETIRLRIINDTWQSTTWYFTLEYTKTTD